MSPLRCPACGDDPPVPGQQMYRCDCGWNIDDGFPACTTDVSPAARMPAPNCDDPGEISLTIPWGFLASDNLRKGLDRQAWKKYREARDNAHTWAMGQVKERPRFADAKVGVSIRFYQPDYRQRDPNNLTKLLCDCLSGVVYVDDDQIVRLEWTDEGVDGDNPRAEITVTSDGFRRAA